MKESLKKSLGLHIAILLLFVIDVPFFWNRDMTISQVPIIVDLNQVKISEMTNLPPKAKLGEEDKKASTIQRKVEEKYTKEEVKKEDNPVKQDEPKEDTKPAPKEETPAPPKKDFLVAPQPVKPKVPVEKPVPVKPEPKPKPKVEPKKEIKKVEEKKEDKSKPTLANPLKSLLASVDALEKEEGEKDATATIKDGTKVNNMGIEGGVGGSYFSELSISETDAIAGRLRACWNLDPGAMGIKDMIVEIRAFLNRDGTVKEVKILDTGRYKSDNHFRSVADSARRAVYICAPYTIFSQKYGDKYDMWSTMLLRFNPLDASIK